MADGVREHRSPVGLDKETRSLIAMYKSTIKKPVEKTAWNQNKKMHKTAITTIRPITIISNQAS